MFEKRPIDSNIPQTFVLLLRPCLDCLLLKTIMDKSDYSIATIIPSKPTSEYKSKSSTLNGGYYETPASDAVHPELNREFGDDAEEISTPRLILVLAGLWVCIIA